MRTLSECMNPRNRESVGSGMIHRVFTVLVAVLLVAACKDVATGPEGAGSIEGRVVNDETGAAVQGASITTSPATSAPLTDSEGRFALRDIEAGEYTVRARKSEFETATVSVAVREDETTEATILMIPDEPGSASDVEAQITSFRNAVATGDSAFAEVEYRVVNDREETVAEYEVIFDIFTPGDVLKQEESGTDLRPDEQDIGSFRKFVGEDPADSVVIADVFTRTGEG